MKLTINKQHLMTESTALSIDDIGYGNPTLEQLQIMGRTNYLDSLFNELSQILPPPNSSEVTQKELNDLVVYTAQLVQDADTRERFLQYDYSLSDYIKKASLEVGFSEEDAENVEKIIDDIIIDTSPLILRIKFNFSRARPYQLAFYYKLQVFPFTTINTDTPAYPSGHAFQAKVITEVLGNKYPKHYHSLKQLSDDICMSRLYLGVHYQSDIDMGIYAADSVLGNKEFKVKYGI
jgi:hypothetical protein